MLVLSNAEQIIYPTREFSFPFFLEQGLGSLPTVVEVGEPICDPGLSLTFDSTSQEVASGTDAIFQETVHLSVDPSACILKCSVDFSSNGVVVGTQMVQIIFDSKTRAEADAQREAIRTATPGGFR